MYQPYPGSNLPPEPSAPQSVPPAVRRAAQVMYVGAAASLIGIIVDFTELNAIKTQLEQRTHTLTPSQLNTAQHIEIGALVAGGLIAAALWIWLAQNVRLGKSWARVVATVLFAIDTISQFAGLAGGPSGLGRVYGLVVWLIGLIAIVLLWQRPARDYFASQSGPRY